MGKDQPTVVHICPKHGPIILAGPHARVPDPEPIRPTNSSGSPGSCARTQRPVSVTISPVQSRKQEKAKMAESHQSPDSKRPKRAKDPPPAYSSSTYRAFASVDDPVGSGPQNTAVVSGVGLLASGRHCIPRRPISDDLSAAPWIRKLIPVMPSSSISAPSSPVNDVKLQRPQITTFDTPDIPSPLQKPVPTRQVRRIAEADGVSMRTNDSDTGSRKFAAGMRSDDPWVKVPNVTPMPNVTNEILSMETNVDGYVAEKH